MNNNPLVPQPVSITSPIMDVNFFRVIRLRSGEDLLVKDIRTNLLNDRYVVLDHPIKALMTQTPTGVSTILMKWNVWSDDLYVSIPMDMIVSVTTMNPETRDFFLQALKQEAEEAMGPKEKAEKEFEEMETEPEKCDHSNPDFKEPVIEEKPKKKKPNKTKDGDFIN